MRLIVSSSSIKDIPLEELLLQRKREKAVRALHAPTSCATSSFPRELAIVGIDGTQQATPLLEVRRKTLKGTYTPTPTEGEGRSLTSASLHRMAAVSSDYRYHPDPNVPKVSTKQIRQSWRASEEKAPHAARSVTGQEQTSKCQELSELATPKPNDNASPGGAVQTSLTSGGALELSPQVRRQREKGPRNKSKASTVFDPDEVEMQHRGETEDEEQAAPSSAAKGGQGNGFINFSLL